MSDVQLQSQPPQSDIQSHQHPQSHHLHPHAQAASQNLNLNPMLNSASMSTSQGPVQGLPIMQDPNLDPKLSGLNEPSKLNLPGILPPNVDPRLGQLDVRNFSPKELLQLLKQIPLLQENAAAAKRRSNSNATQPTAGPSTLPNIQPPIQPPPAPATPPSPTTPSKGVKRKRGRVGDDGEELDAEDWSRQRKDNHKEVERRRRGNINHGINELARVVPFAGTDRAKSAILHRAVTYIHHLKENEARNIEKWTLEKLLMDQAMADLQLQLEEMRKLWEEERQAKQRALLELDVIRSSGVNVNIPAGANVQQSTSNGNQTTRERSSSVNNSVPAAYESRAMYQAPPPQQRLTGQAINDDNEDTKHEDSYPGMTTEIHEIVEDDEDAEDEDAEHQGDDDDEEEDGGEDDGKA